MIRMWRLVLVCVVGVLLAGGSAAFAQTSTSDWDPVTADRLLSPEDGDWMSYRRTYDVTGFSPLDQIDRANVDELRLVWAHSMGDGSRWVPTPVVANGLMFVAESDRITAFEVTSGDVAWVHQRSYPDDIRQSQALGRSRGVSVYGDMIYWGPLTPRSSRSTRGPASNSGR